MPTEGIQLVLTDGRVAIDNNPAERALRPSGIGRKNWRFAGADTGAETLARAIEVVVLFRTVLRLGQDASGVCSCRFSYLCVAKVCDVRSLNQIIEWRGKPQTTRVDNGPEYISGKVMAYYNKERRHSTHGILPPDEVDDGKTEQMKPAALMKSRSTLSWLQIDRIAGTTSVSSIRTALSRSSSKYLFYPLFLFMPGVLTSGPGKQGAAHCIILFEMI